MTDSKDTWPISRPADANNSRIDGRGGMPDATDFPEALLNAPVRFWMCLNREHKNVTWDGDVATCPDCGLTSEMTNRYASVLRAMLADKIEAAIPVPPRGSAIPDFAGAGMRRAAQIVRGEA